MARMALRADASRLFLGYIWWVLEPLLWVGVFYVVFVIILGTREGDFLPFLMVGKLSFVWFSKSVTQASNSIGNPFFGWILERNSAVRDEEERDLKPET